MIPLASELRSELTFRKDVVTESRKESESDTVAAQFRLVLDLIEAEILRVLREKEFLATEIFIQINPKHRSSFVFDRLKLYLSSRGYTLTLGAESITVSWS